MSAVRANVKEPRFDEIRQHPGFRARRARIGRQLGTRKLGASLWELPPGEAAYPYHYHLAEEELLVVLAGRPRLRDPSGWRQLADGEVLTFPLGEAGAHQVLNDGDAPVRFLAVSNQQPDVVIRPDSETVSLFERRPEGGGLAEHFRLDRATDYFDGERAPDRSSA